jgi:MoxR-like ATPase
MRPEIRALQEALSRLGYLASEEAATAVCLAEDLGKPLLVEGDAGVGKTELAKVLARHHGTELVRLQCYEGLDVATALYEWDYPRQLLRLRAAEARGAAGAGERLEASIYDRDLLLERPLLRALTRREGPAVLLVDELDRADEAFEAFLLELLSDFQVSIPELGTVRALHVPHVVITSNATRELGDALRRRCLYLHLDHPALEQELRILQTRVPEAPPDLSAEAARFLKGLRARPLARRPGVAEGIDWTRALSRLGAEHLEADLVRATLGCLVKDRHDLAGLGLESVARLVADARGGEAHPS